MTNEEVLKKLVESSASQSESMVKTQIALTAIQTAFIGVLRALDEQPQLVELIATEIAAQSEKTEALYLGSTMPDEMLRNRAEVLRGLLPPNIRRAAKL